MPAFLTANRVAAIATWMAALGALILAVVGTFPHSWQNMALAIAALLVKGATTLKFLDGAQKSEALQSGLPTPTGSFDSPDGPNVVAGEALPDGMTTPLPHLQDTAA